MSLTTSKRPNLAPRGLSLTLQGGVNRIGNLDPMHFGESINTK